MVLNAEAVAQRCFVKKVVLQISENSQVTTCNRASKLFHDGGRYHIETSPLICSANQWTDFYMITDSVRKELKKRLCHRCFPVNFEKFVRTPFL